MRKKFLNGIKVRTISAVLMIVCGILVISVFGITIKIKKMHEDLSLLTNDFINTEIAINDLKISSGKLTYFAISFMEKRDFDYLNKYYYELNKVNRREKAKNVVELSHHDDAVDFNTQLAIRESNELAEIETYAMALMANAYDVALLNNKDIKYPIILTPDHKKLSAEEKMEVAQDMLFGDLHMRSRELVSEYTEIASGTLLNMYRSQEQQCNNKIQKFVTMQLVLIITLIIIFIAFNFLLVFYIFIPLHNHLIAIQKNDKMKVQGAYEVRYIATAYNAVADKNALDASMLKHKAEHDPLTGLINREAFDHIMSVLSASQEPVAYLIIDIDLFKNINDQYGHVIGDKVLVKIAQLLTEQFRATDYVGRIGGDEFAVIMTKFGTASIIDIIRRKIDGLNKMLQNEVDDGLPPVSLSVGVAVSDLGFKTVLIENADKALYRVKRGGRCNCFFYGAE